MATVLTEHHLLSPMLGILWDEEMQVSDVSPGHSTSGLNSSAPALLHDSSHFFCVRSSDFGWASFQPDQEGNPACWWPKVATGLRSSWCIGAVVNLSSTSVADKEPNESRELAAKSGDALKKSCLWVFLHKQISAMENAFVRSFCSTCLHFPFLLFSPGYN